MINYINKNNESYITYQFKKSAILFSIISVYQVITLIIIRVIKVIKAEEMFSKPLKSETLRKDFLQALDGLSTD